ncbi:hypothetical protein FRC05_011528 [Tulasnella sp. 425]|nr:hypothetical protein FRC05_011528 [Tulasnella sp. 425]
MRMVILTPSATQSSSPQRSPKPETVPPTPAPTRFFPIQDLPAELFIQILLLSINRNTSSGEIYKHVLHLTQVNKFWKTTVINCPSFWSRLVQYLPPETWDTVLKHNPEGPLEVTCMNYNNPNADLEGFLELAAPHSRRWSGMWFRGMLTDKVLAHMELPTPQMTELGICRSRGPESPERRIKLSDGAGLRYVDVDGMSLPWDTPRLAGLRVVQLSGIRDDIPTVSQLTAMLQASPQLWWLLLSYLGTKYDDESDTDSATSDGPSTYRIGPRDWSTFKSRGTPIYLPYLSTMMLDHIPDDMKYGLLTSIEAPKCECLAVDSINISFIQSRNRIFSSLLAGPIHHSTRMSLLYSRATGYLCIHSASGRSEIPNDWINYIEESPGFDIVINMGRANPGTAWASITDLLKAVGIKKPVDLKLVGRDGRDFPPDILGEWPFITGIETGDHYNAEEILQYIARPKPRILNSDGEVENLVWCCPDLDKITLGDWKQDGGHSAQIVLEQFFQARYGLDITKEAQAVKKNTPLEKGKLVLPSQIAQKVLEEFPVLTYVD